MTRLDIANAIIKVTEKVESGELAFVDKAVLESIPDLNHYVEQAVYASLRRDNNAVVRAIQDAQMTTAARGLQLGLPGLEHAALPSAVRDLESPSDKPRMKSIRKATAREIKDEIRLYRRRVNAQDRVVSGYEATMDAITSTLAIDDDTTGEQIEQALRAIEAG